mgnify:CR=1 FL=1
MLHAWLDDGKHTSSDIEVDVSIVEAKEEGGWDGWCPVGAADDGKHASSVIEVDTSLLEAKQREGWRERCSPLCRLTESTLPAWV